MKIVDSFMEIALGYRCVFFDAYGVLKSSTGMSHGVAEVLTELKSRGVEYYVITNDASRSPEQMAEVYTQPGGGPLVSAERIVPSGMLASEFIAAKVPPGRVAYIGKPTSAYYIETANRIPLPIAEWESGVPVNALALLDDEGFDWFADINRALNLLRGVNLPVVVANTDLSYPVNGKDVYVAVGSLANMIEGIIGKEFIRFGKPDTQIFNFTYDLALARDPSIQKRQCLMVGDTLDTDIIGGNKFGLDTMLVLSGVTQPETAQVQIEARGILPTYICDSIRS